MNTQLIQKQCPEEYEQLFSHCPVVISAPSTFLWAGEYAIDYEGLGIAQHIPLRTYVGFAPNNENEYRVGGYKEYITSKSCYMEMDLKTYDFSGALGYLNELKKVKGGYDIYILSEAATNCGMNAFGALSVCLAYFHEVINNNIKKNNVNNWKNMISKDLIGNEEFNKVFRLSCKLNAIFHNGYASAIGSFVSLVWTKYPIYFMCEKTIDKEDLLGEYDKFYYFGGKLEEIYTIRKFLSWPIDIILIFSGEQRPSDVSVRVHEEVMKHYSEISSFIKNNLYKKDHNNKKLQIWKNITKKDALFMNFVDLLSTISMEILIALGEAITYRSEKSIQDLQSKVHNYYDTVRLNNMNSRWVNQLITNLYNYSLKHAAHHAGIKMTGVSKAGDILFVSSMGDFHHNWQEIIDYIKKEDPTKRIVVDYDSWIDGFEEKGIQYEQDLLSGCYSRWISKEAYKITTINKEKINKCIFIDKKDINKEIEKYPLLIDKNNNKIFIFGKRLTSKNIFSSKATIKLILHLAQFKDKFISSSELPQSNYSKDRNSFFNKIILPLNKIIKKEIGNKKILTIKGGLTDFEIKLNNEIEIAILDSIN